MPHKFPVENSHKLESDDRYALIPPEETLERFGIKDGMTVVDIGAGTGFFSRAASFLVGERGKVYAADISFEMLEVLRSFGIPKNVEWVHCEEFTIPVQSYIADFVLLAFVAHETSDLHRFFREAARLTKPEGRIIVIDWKKQQEDHSPDESERLSEEELASHCKLFIIEDSGELNPSHYYFILKKKNE